MPFIRYTRDKRGYESTLVMHAYRPQNGPPRTRVLYLFRSPAHLKAGRTALDPEVVEALEHTHPDVSFDWTALLRESASLRPDDRERDRDRDARHARGARKSQRRPDAAPPPPVVIDDQTTLGRVVGAAEAIRLRRQYSELTGRIARRARTPEDRDRLMERAGRLNPDDWPDEDAVRAGLATLAADWEAIAIELPQRRRGRRGGRRRIGEGAGAEASPVIMAEGGDADGNSTFDAQGDVDDFADLADGGDAGAVGAAGPAEAHREDAAAAGAASDDFPGDR